jgi:Flp pilus assembly CpaF family ATPase
MTAAVTESMVWWDHLVPYCPLLGVFLADDGISEIEVNSNGQIYTEASGVTTPSGAVVPQYEIEAFITRVARWRGQDISDREPLLSVQMPDGSRLSAVCPPVSPGWCFTIRKHSRERWTMEALVENATISPMGAAMLAGFVSRRRSVLISGGTSTGKTSLLTALSEFIPASERVVVIEDVSEIKIDLPNLVRFEAQPAAEGRKEISIRNLVKHALRFTPNRIILGEVRGGEAFDLLQVLNTGHAGSLSTIHANTAERALSRLADLTLQADVGITERFVKKSIAEAIDIVVHVEREGGRRRVTEIAQVEGYDRERSECRLVPVLGRGE